MDPKKIFLIRSRVFIFAVSFMALKIFNNDRCEPFFIKKDIKIAPKINETTGLKVNLMFLKF